MGTGIKAGSGRAVVVHTAAESEFGKISKSVQSKETPTDFERGVRKFGAFLIRITAVMLAAIFLFHVLMKKPLFDSFMFALALSVGLTPQLLPAIISINLAKGAKRMAEQKVIDFSGNRLTLYAARRAAWLGAAARFFARSSWPGCGMLYADSRDRKALVLPERQRHLSKN